MIGYISGNIIELSEHSVLIHTQGGLGYEIWIHEITFSHLINTEKTELYVYHHITENAQSLFGFTSLDEKKLFTELIKISGVGGKVALLILSLGKDSLIQAVQADDKKVIESVKGIGKKMAEKIILELKDKDFVKTHISQSIQHGVSPHQTTLPATLMENIKMTLTTMGYQGRDIERVMATIPEELTQLQDILPYMIREL
ncbi:Holliday junction branch migration protein RuvA [Candidatus Gracilibacteria bacterium]|nr:Holliday junction branch migration protein RuvA [Candidatus Gracilibacteria bacterium]